MVECVGVSGWLSLRIISQQACFLMVFSDKRLFLPWAEVFDLLLPDTGYVFQRSLLCNEAKKPSYVISHAHFVIVCEKCASQACSRGPSCHHGDSSAPR
jgi:hypothetical protein